MALSIYRVVKFLMNGEKMNEQMMIEIEQAKGQRKLAGQLRKIESTGFASNNIIESLLSNDYIEFSVPNKDIPYNHYVLSNKAKVFLTSLTNK